MQTVRSLAERLDMTPDEALEKLRYMLFEVDDVDTKLTDQQIDLLIDADDDDEVAEKFRKKQLAEQEKIRKRNERLRQNAKKAAAKRKAAAEKKRAAKKKPAAKKKAESKEPVPDEPEVAVAPAETPEAEPPAEAPQQPAAAELLPEEEAAPVAEAAFPAAELLPDEPPEPETPPVAELLPEEEETAPVAEEAPAPAEERPAADVTHEPEPVAAEAVETPPETPERVEPAPAVEPEGGEGGARVITEPPVVDRPKRPDDRPPVQPDPAVVAEVKRRAAERMRGKDPGGGRGEVTTTGGRPETSAPPAPHKAGHTGKTARKRLKKADRARREDELRREAEKNFRELQAGTTKKRRRPARDRTGDGGEAVPQVIEVDEAMTVEELSQATDVPVNDLILSLMDHDIMAHKNQPLDIDLVRKIAEPEGFEVRAAIPEEEEVLAPEPDDPAKLQPRAPVVTVMGHVDHGKTTLLDYIRHENVAAGEAGGITQHIAAYEARVQNGRVVFLDTPGHEAFTQMRARGAQSTDVVVLVVAADDGVMPQTREAIDHARAAEVPIVVAINKCDKPDAQPDRIRQELSQLDLLCEEWGGKTIMKEVSAKTGQGVDELMEHLALETEMLELRANPDKAARGVVVESEISRGQGPVAWVLVQEGTLRQGDVYLAGKAFGRVRAMLNYRGEMIEEAGPATPVVVTGFSEPPDAGDPFIAMQDERIARGIATKRADLARHRQDRAMRRVTLEDFHDRLQAGEKHELNVVIKADVQGSVDVFGSSLSKIGNEEVSVRVVHAGVGSINESDVLLASASDAVIIGFHVTANARVQKMAEQEGVEVRTYRVIYEAIEDVRQALEGLLEPETREVVTGHAEVRQLFRSSAVGTIAGSYVTDGQIERNSRVRVVRDGTVVHEGRIGSLRRGKEDARSLQSGFECGITLDNFDDVKEGDVLEAFRMESVAKTLA